ncbi:hypothetical protein H1R20_g15784, partial [Candolleomyces eurysporus]
MDEVVLQDLGSLQQSFTSSLREESSTLSTFLASWSKFNEFVHSCHDTLKAETLDLVYSFANSVSVVASSMVDISVTSTALMDQFSTEVLEILGPAEQLNGHTRNPSYIESCYQWLHQNHHNPYPSARVRDEICRESRSPRKDVDAWFVDARKRIGWNALRRDRFGNRRADIVEAATQFFLGQEKQGKPLEPSIENAFIQIEHNITSLFNSKFEQSPLAKKLDCAVKDMTAGMKEQLEEDRSCRRSQRRKRREYPTPDHSPSSSRGSLPPSPSTFSDCTLASTASFQKRRAPSVDTDDDNVDNRPTKRHRYSSESPSNIVTHLPSPAPSTELDVSLDQSPLEPRPTLLEFDNGTSRKRKRCLSDVVAARIKSPRTSPRPQAVSNPCPAPSMPSDSLEEWLSGILRSDFSTLMDMPPPVSVEVPDSSLPVQVESFSGWPESMIPEPAKNNDPFNSSSTEALPESFPLNDTDWLNHPVFNFETNDVPAMPTTFNDPQSSFNFSSLGLTITDPFHIPSLPTPWPHDLPFGTTYGITSNNEFPPPPLTAVPELEKQAKLQELRLLETRAFQLLAEIS